ncbi:hypothetical protein AVEN_170803-1 [Araneus ventricosus]|uniref:Uncharacterized protein n=1 Tax=Araneus ventricosus TaxID=182803 RepID=A0A4Y2VSZ2_ARAVE|nr:hypothetical protein AVEN_170803-1 [Araneus ventricosus]
MSFRELSVPRQTTPNLPSRQTHSQLITQGATDIFTRLQQIQPHPSIDGRLLLITNFLCEVSRFQLPIVWNEAILNLILSRCLVKRRVSRENELPFFAAIYIPDLDKEMNPDSQTGWLFSPSTISNGYSVCLAGFEPMSFGIQPTGNLHGSESGAYCSEQVQNRAKLKSPTEFLGVCLRNISMLMCGTEQRCFAQALEALA